jgi:hypothetical protein
MKIPFLKDLLSFCEIIPRICLNAESTPLTDSRRRTHANRLQRQTQIDSLLASE